MNNEQLKNQVSLYVLGLRLEAGKSGGYRDADYICYKSKEITGDDMARDCESHSCLLLAMICKLRKKVRGKDER